MTPRCSLCDDSFPLFSFFSRDKKRLANMQRNVHIHESFGQWANTHRDDGYTEQGQEALQHL